MRRFLLPFLAVLLSLPTQKAQATDLPEPIVEVDFEKSQTIPGQFLPLRITVLVPTWMPQPAVFPSLDGPNVRIRLPDRATSPTSKRIDGEDWSGVSRRYMIAPLVPGTFTLPGGAIEITYADPDNTSVPLTASVELAPITIEGLVPDGAENLSPFIAASDLKLTQEVSDQTIDVKPGDSIRRTITVSITGTSPMILPQLTEPPQIAGFAAYADTPVLEEKDDRGVLSGSRQETVTLMAQQSGNGELPRVELSWYNISTKTIETASLDAVPVSAVGSPMASREPHAWLDLRTGLGLAVLLSVLALGSYFAGPRLIRYQEDRRIKYRASKAHARQVLLTAIGKRDYPATVAALQTWAMRPPRLSQSDQQMILDALRPLSAQRYGRRQPDTGSAAWKSLEMAVVQTAKDRSRAVGHSGLPALNP